MPPLENFPKTTQPNPNSLDLAIQNSIPDPYLSDFDFDLLDQSQLDESHPVQFKPVGTTPLPGPDSPSTFLPVGSSSPNPGISITPDISSPNTALTELDRSVCLPNATPTSEVTLPARSSARMKSTEDQYQIRVRGLYHQSSRLRTTDHQNPVEPSPVDLVTDLVNSSIPDPLTGISVRSYAAWQLYRSALLWYLSSRRELQEAYETAYQTLVNTKVTAGPRRKAALKTVFHSDDFEVLINTLGSLDRKNTRWGSKTAYWMQAGVAAGARGNEWLNTCWLDRDKCQLLIPNSKIKASAPAYKKMADSNDESVQSVYDLDGEFVMTNMGVELDPSELTSHRIVRIDRNDMIYVDFHLASIENHGIAQSRDGVSRSVAFEHYTEMCRRTLRKACEIAFKGKRYYRLHHTRSQFSANKKVDHTLGTVATMMGHSGIRTTMLSYGSRADGLRSRKGLSMIMNQTHGNTYDASGGESVGDFPDDMPG